MLAEEGVERLQGAHCYEFFAGAAAFAALADEEPGTFYLTDFLARNFERLVIRGLGLDRHPSCCRCTSATTAGSSTSPRPTTRSWSRWPGAAARPLGLAFEHRARTGFGELADVHGRGRRRTAAGARARPRSRSRLTGHPDRHLVARHPGPGHRQGRPPIAARSSSTRASRSRSTRPPSRAGKRAYDDYIEEWRKTSEPCGDDLEAEVKAEVERLEADYTKHRLAELIQSGGVAGGPALPPATTSGDLTDMTDTVLSSATREVVIGFDRPFVIIGERINPTGRKLLAEEMKAGDFSRVERDAIAQVEAGAHMLDVNAGIPLADEPAILAQTIQLVQSLTDVPLSIDSLDRRGARGRPRRLPGQGARQLRDRRGGAPRARPAARQASTARRSSRSRNDETGISEDPDVRFAVAKRIVERAADHGIPREDVIVDPLVMPIGAMAHGRPAGLPHRPAGCATSSRSTRPAARRNVSFGLPNREGINGAFLAMAIAPA